MSIVKPKQYIQSIYVLLIVGLKKASGKSKNHIAIFLGYDTSGNIKWISNLATGKNVTVKITNTKYKHYYSYFD